MPSLSRHAAASTLATLLCFAAAAAESPVREPVLSTLHFAFFSDFDTNLNDRLIAAGKARSEGKSEPFQSGPEAACLEELPAAEHAAWNLAVAYYAEVISPVGAADHEQFLLRLELAGIVADDEWEESAERRFVGIARGFREAAAPAYETCRWPAQDQANRRWIEAIEDLLAAHEDALAGRLSEVYQTPWRGLPIPVDVVETVNWAGAHTVNLRPPGCHILISSSKPGHDDRAALELVFHEAGHFLTGRTTPLATALAAATERLGNPFRGDLKHAVNFYLTGEVVRRALKQAGEPDYTPYLYAKGLYNRGIFRRSAESTLPAYLDGERSLVEAVEALIEALGEDPGG